MAVRHVTTIAELKAAFDYYPSCPEPLTVEIDNDLDFNDSSYYRYDGDFFYLGQGNQQFTINGNGHTLANIYLFPNRALIDYNTYSRGEKPVINDLKFEIVSNNATIIRHHNYINFQGETMAQWMINRCTFNVKVYSAVNPLFVFETLSGGGSSATFGFVNCIFNLYISGINVNQTGNSGNPDFFWPIILFFHGNYYYGYEGCCIISGCMFNIRNATNKFIMFVKTTGNPDSARVVFDNDAIFYSDIGLEQPDYYHWSGSNYPPEPTYKQHHIFTAGTASTTSIQNCYIAQFDQYMNLNPDFEKPRFELFLASTGQDVASVTNKINTCFYDKDKIYAYQNYRVGSSASGSIWGEILDNSNGVLSALTTSQCKDAIALGSVGYIFSQEV